MATFFAYILTMMKLLRDYAILLLRLRHQYYYVSNAEQVTIAQYYTKHYCQEKV